MSKTRIGGPYSYTMCDKTCSLGALFEPRIGSPKSQCLIAKWPKSSASEVERDDGEMPLIFLRGNLMPGARVLDGKNKSRVAW